MEAIGVAAMKAPIPFTGRGKLVRVRRGHWRRLCASTQGGTARAMAPNTLPVRGPARDPSAIRKRSARGQIAVRAEGGLDRDP
jgi:hypothetical protein